MKATGARVNLTAANVILLCDPWWTPGAEAQAQLSLLNAHTMQLPFLPALRSELFDIGYTNALGYRAPFLDCSGGAGGFSVYISLLVFEWPPADGLRGAEAWQEAHRTAWVIAQLQHGRQHAISRHNTIII